MASTEPNPDVALVEQLIGIDQSELRKEFLRQHAWRFTYEDAELLRQEAIRLLRVNIADSLEVVGCLMQLADHTNDQRYLALGLWAEGHVRAIGLGEYASAIQLYDRSAEIFGHLADPVLETRVLASKVYPLSCLGRNDEAIRLGEQASEKLRMAEQWHSLATHTLNIGVLYARLGRDLEALQKMDEARGIYLRLDNISDPNLALIEMNRGGLLRNLGRFDEALEAGNRAWQTLQQLGLPAEAARARWNLAITYMVQDRYNEALRALTDSREALLEDGRVRDAFLIDVYVSECMLQLGRFGDALEMSTKARSLLSDRGAQFEHAQAMLNEGIAHAGLGDLEAARSTLERSSELFSLDGNRVWRAISGVELAVVLTRLGKYSPASELAINSANEFNRSSLPVRRAYALLVAARAAVGSGDIAGASQAASKAAGLIAELEGIPSLAYKLARLRGDIALSNGDDESAIDHLVTAVGQLEQGLGRMMIEFRVDYLENKSVVFEDLVDLCMKLDRTDQAFEFVERAKSRSLIDMLSYHINMGLEARETADQELVDRILELRQQRDQLMRAWVASKREPVSEHDAEIAGDRRAGSRIRELERRITELWHQLLIRNADYARESDIWQSTRALGVPELSHEQILLEYFVVHGQIVRFCISNADLRVQRLRCSVDRISELLSLLRLNRRIIEAETPDQHSAAFANTRDLLRDLHGHLLSQLPSEMDSAERLAIVPHGILHYVPFHALLDAGHHLVERLSVTYLPSAGLANHLGRGAATSTDRLAVGHSYHGRLPYALEEVDTICALVGADRLVESDATHAAVTDRIKSCSMIHFATHGEFRSDDPLFSGLALEDGWLTTFDVFNSRIGASLVTLSGCQTGMNIVRAGDELYGLARAFLYAGSASLLMTLWPVRDRATAVFMHELYSKLSQGVPKEVGLAETQRAFARGDAGESSLESRLFRHPYFWAPFFLVGEGGPL